MHILHTIARYAVVSHVPGASCNAQKQANRSMHLPMCSLLSPSRLPLRQPGDLETPSLNSSIQGPNSVTNPPIFKTLQ